MQKTNPSGEASFQGLEPLEPRVLLSVSANAFDFSAASFLGGSGDDAVRGAVLQDDGTVVLAANLSDASPGGLPPTLLNGATASSPGALVRLSPDGQDVLGVTRLAEKVLDLSADDTGNLYIALWDQGFAKVNPTADAVLWSKDAADLGFANVQRIDAGPMGYAAVLGGGSLDSGSNLGGYVKVYDESGTELGGVSGGKWKNDVAIDEASQTVVYLGYRNAEAYDGETSQPVQIGYYRGISYDAATTKYTGYDWPTNDEDPNFLNGPENNMADTRGYRAEIGDDGLLYLAFESAGGNNIFNHDPFDISQPASLAGGDGWHVPYNTGANHITYFGRYNPSDGAFLNGNHFLTRLSDTSGNTARIQAGNIMADEYGRVFLGGSSAWGLPLETHPLNPGGTSFNPGVNGNYLGGAYLLAMDSDMSTRLFCTRLTGSWTRGLAVRNLDTESYQIAFGGQVDGELYVVDGDQMSPSLGQEGWYGVIADSSGNSANNAPAASFSATSIGGGPGTTTLELDASATSDPDGDPLEYIWHFGDGVRAAGQVVQHTFDTTSDQTVTLTVLDDSTGWSHDSITFGPPVAEFTVSDRAGDAPMSIDFDATGSTDPNDDASLIAYEWDFGDGAAAAGRQVSHTYSQPGVYEVTLTVTDPLGGSDTASDTIGVADPDGWSLRLDFEGADDDTAEGYTRALLEEYTAGAGFGYASIDPEYRAVSAEGYHSHDMLEDGHHAGTTYHVYVPATYLVDVPNGTYQVIAQLAAGKYGYTFMSMKAEGVEKFKYHYVPKETHRAAAFTTTVTDGQLTLEMDASLDQWAWWNWSGLEIFQLAEAANESPELAGLPHAPQPYADGSGVQAVAPDLALTDDAVTSISEATVRISDGYLSSEDVLSATDVGNITSSWDPLQGVLTLTGEDTAANYQAALRSVTYTNLSAAADGGERAISFRVSDGVTDSNLATAYLLPSSAGTASLVEDFESYAAGDLLNDQAGWTAENDANIVSDPAEAANLVGHVWDRHHEATFSDAGLMVSDGDVQNFFFRARIGNTGSGGQFGLSEAGNLSGVKAGVEMEDTDVQIGPAGGDSSWAPANDVWYRIWVEVDNDSDTQTVYLQSDDDAYYAEKTSLGSTPFAGGSAGDLVDFEAKFNNHPDDFHVYLDDLAMVDPGAATVDLPMVGVLASDFIATEGTPSDKAELTFTRSGDTGAPLTVHYTVSSTADAGEYTASPALDGTITIPAGESITSVEITAVDDGWVEAFETLTVHLEADSSYNLSSRLSASVGIEDDEVPATITVAATDGNAAEAGEDPGEIVISRTGSTEWDLDVNYTVSGAATIGDDYSADPSLTGTITIPAGAVSTAISITPVDDGNEEGFEDVVVTLATGGPEYVIGDPDEARVGILDDEKLVDYTLIDDFEAYAEGDAIEDQPNWGVSDAGAMVEPDPDDAGNLVLHSYNRSEDVVNTHQDIYVSDGMTGTLFFRMYIDSAMPQNAYAGFHVGTANHAIAAGPAVDESGFDGSLALTGTWYNLWVVADHAANTYDVYVQGDGDPAYAGQMRASNDQAFRTSWWADPQALTSFNIGHDNNPDTTSVRVDDIYFTAGDGHLVNPLAPDAAVVTVEATDPEASEDGTNIGEFTITRSGDTTGPLDVSYTVAGFADAADYTASPELTGTITIPAGSASAAITITGVQDSDPELDETVELSLQGGTGYLAGFPSTATVTILDDDGPAQVPFGPGPWQLADGLRLQAEDFDTMTEGSGEGEAYHDTSSGNSGGDYRDTDVDIQATSDDGGGYNVGWIDGGEWLEYTVDVAGGTYDIHARVASSNSDPGDLRVLLDGTELGTYPVEGTGAWQNWVTLTLGDVALAGGAEQILRLEMVGGSFNVNWLEFESADSTPPTVTGHQRNNGEDRPGELTELSFTFGEDVSASVDAGDLTLYDQTHAASVDTSATTVSYDVGTNTATWDLAPLALPAAYYTATLPAGSVADAAGNPLAADYRVADILVAPGGDATSDGVVDVSDLGVLAGNWRETSGMAWGDGDFTGDGAVDVSDLGILAGNWRQDVNPEPTGIEDDSQIEAAVLSTSTEGSTEDVTAASTTSPPVAPAPAAVASGSATTTSASNVDLLQSAPAGSSEGISDLEATIDVLSGVSLDVLGG